MDGPTMTDLLLKRSGPVADQYRVLAGDQVVGHIRLSESAPTHVRLELFHEIKHDGYRLKARRDPVGIRKQSQVHS
jgi:hypothetical protein